MYEFVDRPVTTLGRGGRFLIWSLRSWVASMAQEECPARTIAPAFARWKMIGGLQPFHRTMLLLNRDALERLQFCSLHCNHVSEHEAIFLCLVRQIGTRHIAQVRDTLALLIEEESVGDLLAGLCELTDRMNDAAILPGPPSEAGPVAPRHI